MNTNDTIKKKYYFITSDVIYEISNRNDFDECCGICPSHNDDGSVKTDTELAAIFPYIKLTYKVNDTGETIEKYLWLQDFIKDGDKYENNKFIAKSHDDNVTTFLDRYINQSKKNAYKDIKNGYLPASLKAKNQKYFGDVPYNDFIDGKNVTVTAVSLTEEQRFFSETKIGELYVETAKNESKNAANRILNRNSQQVDSLTLTVKSL